VTRVSTFDLPDKREGNVRSFEPTNGVETIVAYDADERTNEPTNEPSTGTDAGDDSIPSLLAPVPVPVPKAAARARRRRRRRRRRRWTGLLGVHPAAKTVPPSNLTIHDSREIRNCVILGSRLVN